MRHIISWASGLRISCGASCGQPQSEATVTAVDNGRAVVFMFNRKEVKGHGEGGALVGHQLQDGDRVLIIEYVTTAGTPNRETVPPPLASAKVGLAGLIVSVDRMECCADDKAALDQDAEKFAMPAYSTVTTEEIVAHAGLSLDLVAKMRAYHAEYGARRWVDL